jgi:hypothetical protein
MVLKSVNRFLRISEINIFFFLNWFKLEKNNFANAPISPAAEARKEP